MTIGIAANLIALFGVVGYVLWRAYPPTEAVRLRNALSLATGSNPDFDWTPPHFPADFRAERLPPPAEFRDIVASLRLGDRSGDWDKALALASHLVERAGDLGPVRADPLTTYRAIRDGHGYCADFVKAFLALAHAAGLSVRQWGFSFDGFGGHGHTVVEVYDHQRRKWLLLDVFNNFHVVDAHSGEPLGALECRQALLASAGKLRMRANGPGRPGFVHSETALEYYRRGVHQWYLLQGNAVFSSYAHPLVRMAGRLSRGLAPVAASIVGVRPRIRILETSENARQVSQLRMLRRQLVVAAGLALLLLATLAAQLIVAARVGASSGSG
jgi:Transglutaminase-like superfamily